MSRVIPDVPKEWKPPQPDSGRTFEIQLITPMFGGGVETRVNDRSFPIRPTSIRGQLQFWWRATVGAQYTTRQVLRAAQSAIWGDTTRASRVQVRVELIEKPSEPKVCAEIKPNHNGKNQVFWKPPFCLEQKNKWGEHDPKPVTYALFPFQGKPANREGPKVEPAHYIPSAKFRLTLICHRDIDFAKQIEPALWAWVNFGGLGGRTRRGCGAIKGLEGEFDNKGKLIRTIKDFAPKDAEDLTEMWKQYMPTLFPQREWPTMAEAIYTGQAKATDSNHTAAMYAWDQVIGLFKHYRQGEGLGRNEGQQPNRPGRSRYPEPEAIRTVLYNPQAPWSHDRMEHIPNDAFPRAELGLPIVFHFQGHGEPPDTVLYPDNDSEGKKRERMASPLVLKPLALQSGKTVPLIVRLQTPALTGVDLRRGDTSLGLPPTTVIRGPRLSGYQDSPLARSPNGSAIEAFIAFARTEGFTEVTR